MLHAVSIVFSVSTLSAGCGLSLWYTKTCCIFLSAMSVRKACLVANSSYFQLLSKVNWTMSSKLLNWITLAVHHIHTNDDFQSHKHGFLCRCFSTVVAVWDIDGKTEWRRRSERTSHTPQHTRWSFSQADQAVEPLCSGSPLICELVSPSCSSGRHVFILPFRCPFINLWLSAALCLKKQALYWLIALATEVPVLLFLTRVLKRA